MPGQGTLIIHEMSIVDIILLSLTMLHLSSGMNVYTRHSNELAQLERSLHVVVFLGKTEEVVNLLESSDKLLLSELLDCSKNLKCPIETALLRGRFDIADLLLANMRSLAPEKSVKEILLRWDNPLLFQMIWKGNKPACKYILETIAKEDSHEDYSTIKYFGMNALRYAAEHHLNEMVRFLRDEFEWREEFIQSGCSSAFESSYASDYSDDSGSDSEITDLEVVGTKCRRRCWRDKGSTSGSSPGTPCVSDEEKPISYEIRA